jgi:hypothetical protein
MRREPGRSDIDNVAQTTSKEGGQSLQNVFLSKDYNLITRNLRPTISSNTLLQRAGTH